MVFVMDYSVDSLVDLVAVMAAGAEAVAVTMVAEVAGGAEEEAVAVIMIAAAIKDSKP